MSRGRAGQALVETALLMPVLLLIVLGAADFGRAFAAGLTASAAARQAAAYAAQHQADGSTSGGSCQRPWGSTIDVAIASASGLSLTCQNVAISAGSKDPYGRTPVTVSINAPFKPLTPFVAQTMGISQVSGQATSRGETW